ncbi:PVC-type heme-binding CxxCH protein [Paludisphaera mucosa]|uniref:HEAT repeat domain-containing protein n=1 Tax=Paludisphaera mucosa TaxID=3030827 RepID=A0ABT6FBD9_9BACT|nr:PVC-type heme-binding CxxCH protein [Paludisphaera mucosa]MDG3004905.1 HEAT repeat domain-containing protein [Paludisphaera mucosa]
MAFLRHFGERPRSDAGKAWRVAVGVIAVWALSASAPVGLARDGRLPDPSLDLPKGSHISVIGNTLADRMQHTGWLESIMHSRFPDHRLTVRNLAFSGDELTIRLRSAGFGTPDEWLAKNRTDVVCAFFGYNESYGGLAQFRGDLDAFIKHTLAQKYNGESAPKLVLFSPIAFEDLHDPSLPDGKEVNLRLERLTAVMSDLAEARGVRFIDLFHPSQKLYAQAPKPLTINGVHLTSEGDKLIAEVVERTLFGDNKVQDPAKFEKLHQAVLDKSDVWFNRYRTVDGYSIYGGRADLAFVENQTNRVVAQREMEVLDVMTANRDKRIWAVAEGGDLQVDDSNTPPFLPVVTNKPGAGPNGEHLFLGGEAAIAKMTPGKGLKVNLFASEEKFPDLAKPMQMTFDARGRLWVACWPTYPHWKPKSPRNDKILIFEDTDGDGVADKQTTFADDLHCPTGFEIVPQGVLVAQAPDLMLLKDTDGDDRADVRVRLLSGLDSADTHHTSNSFRSGPGGDVYFQEGTFHHSQVETPFGPPVRLANAGVFRYEPRSQKIDVYVTYPFANPHGHVFDRWGQDFVTDGTGNVNYFAAAFSGHLDFPEKHRPMKPYFQQRTRPCGGTEILSSKHFPDDWQGDLLVANVIGFQGIHRYRYQDEGSGFTAVEQEPLVFSSDPNFRPVDIETGPDGAVYFLDWQNPIIGHMQHNLRDPSRDAAHGRVYRVTHEGRPLSPQAAIAGRPVEELLALLKSPEDRVRYRAKAVLCGHDAAEVLPALAAWVEKIDAADPDHDHQVLEALWVHQTYDVVNLDLLKRCLTAADPRARAAAVRVLCCWRDRTPDALDVLRKLARDEHPRVRLEVVRAASFFTEPDALDVALSTAESASDYYLDYARGETLRALEPYVKKALREGRAIEFRSDAAARYFLDRAAPDDLLQMKRGRPVLREILFRKGVREEDRRKALADLAALVGRSPAQVLIEDLAARDAEGDAGLDDAVAMELARMLGERDRAELVPIRPQAEKLATSARAPIARRIGLAAMVAADGSADAAWALAVRSVASLRDFLAATPLIRDPIVRSALYPRIEPLLRGLPEGLAADAGATGKGTLGRFVRIALPRRGTLTLAEVEVISDGRNVATHGKASQKNTANGGDAARAVDGNASGSYGGNGQTHTEEQTDAPWWEVDLGSEVPIEAVVVHNRTEGSLGRRLQGYELTILDGSRQVVDRRKDLPAPAEKARLEYAGDGRAGLIRRAAMDALTTLRGHEPETFRALAKFVREGVDRRAAILAIQKLPPASWPDDELAPLADVLLAEVARIPVADRRTPAALDALQLGDLVAARLPADRARAVRKALGDLGVRAIRVGTVLEQMRYDVDRIVVQAGKPVEFVFENVDVMPHNFVVTQAGSLEEVGQLAESTGLQADAMKRQYVPASGKILLASKLLQPRDVERLAFTPPTTPGVLPYVCTYPGHWRRMYGALYVVEDLDAYLAAPEAYLAAHPLPVADELLKSTRPRTEWTFDDLKPSIAQLDAGRSFQNGRQLFQLATCATCHQLGGVGAAFGPDLAKLDPKQAPADLLKNVLDPSANINEKFAGYAIELESGQVVSGLIVEETADAIKVVENPLASVVPRQIPKADVSNRAKSTVSIMPKGLLDKLTREEILDLIAYIAAGGNPDNPLFRHDHAAHGQGPAGHAAGGSGH